MMLLRLFVLLLLSSSICFPSFLTDSAKMSYSIRSMGRGGASVAEPYGADSLTSNPAGLSQSGSGLHLNNLDHVNHLDHLAHLGHLHHFNHAHHSHH